MPQPNISYMVKAIPANLMKDFLLNNIERMLRENSGGVKMTALVCEITSKLCENGYDVPESLVSEIEKTIEEHKDIDVLIYADNVVNSVIREKQFVHFHLP